MKAERNSLTTKKIFAERKKLTNKERIDQVKSKSNRKYVEKFIFHIKSEGIKERRIEKYMTQLRNLSEWLGKDFKKAKAEDIRKLVVFIDERPYSPLTKGDYKVCIKRFYKWLEGDNEMFPKKVRWIKSEP